MMVNCQFLLENVVNCFIYIYSTFVQVWPKGMKHHLFRTNNFHSAWRFLRFIFEHIDTFLFTMGTNNSPFKCFISTLLSSWLQHLWVVFFLKFTSPGFSTLGSWVMFFASFQIRVFPQGESVFPTHAETLLFSIPHQLVQVNSWDIPNDSFRMRLIISYHIWSVYAPFFSCLEQISNWNILKSTEFHCQATGRKRGQGRSCDDAFGISICPVLGVFGGVFCPPWKLSGFCLFLVVSTLGMESPSHSWAQGPTEPIVLNQDFPEASTSRCNRPQHAWREVFPV